MPAADAELQRLQGRLARLSDAASPERRRRGKVPIRLELWPLDPIDHISTREDGSRTVTAAAPLVLRATDIGMRYDPDDGLIWRVETIKAGGDGWRECPANRYPLMRAEGPILAFPIVRSVEGQRERLLKIAARHVGWDEEAGRWRGE